VREYLQKWLGEEKGQQGLVRAAGVERLLPVVHPREVGDPRPLHLEEAQAHAELAHPQMGPPNVNFCAATPKAFTFVLPLARRQTNVGMLSRARRGPPLLVLQLFFMPAGGLDPRSLGGLLLLVS
jgi:hypothetical protein